MKQDGPELTVFLYSFGYQQSGIPTDESGHGGGFVFDCRALPNPYWDDTLRPHRGTAPPIAAFMQAHPQVSAFAEHAGALVLRSAHTYRELRRERLMVAFGCTGGRHRSVYLAEVLAKTLRAAGIRVVLRHLDIEREG